MTVWSPVARSPKDATARLTSAVIVPMESRDMIISAVSSTSWLVAPR